MELFKTIFLVGGFKELVRLLCLLVIFFAYCRWLRDTIHYFMFERPYIEEDTEIDWALCFKIFGSWVYVVSHVAAIIYIIIWAWR